MHQVKSTDSGSKPSSVLLSRLLHKDKDRSYHRSALSGLHELIHVKHLELQTTRPLCASASSCGNLGDDGPARGCWKNGCFHAHEHLSSVAGHCKPLRRFSVILSGAYPGRGSRLRPGEGRLGLRPTGSKRKREVPRVGGAPGRGGLATPGLWGSEKGAALGAFPSGILRQGPRLRRLRRGRRREQTFTKHCVCWLCAQGSASCRPPFISPHNPVGQGISPTHLPDGKTEARGRNRTCQGVSSVRSRR